MYAPAYKTISDLNGRWALNKSLSDSIEPILALQGIGWITRKGIAAAGLTLNMKQYREKDTAGVQPDSTWEPASPSEDPVVIHFDQIITGGLKGTSETRFCNGMLHAHTDWLFGTVNSQNVFRSHAEVAALADTHLAGKGKHGPWLDEGDLLYTVAKSPNGWVACQVWGFQKIDVGGAKERRFSRNVTVTKGKDRQEVRLVYDYAGELEA